MKRRIVTFFFFATALFFLTNQNGSETRFAFTETLDQWWLDFCIANSSDQITEASVTLIQIDDDYESTLPSDHLTRLDYAVILANVEKFKPHSVALLPPLQWKEKNVINQRILESQCLKTPALTLAAKVENSPVSDKKDKNSPYQALTQIEGDLTKITTFTRTLAYPEKETRGKGKVAFSEIELIDQNNEDGILMLPLVARYQDNILPSFILLALVQHEKLTLDDVRLQLPPAVPHAQILIADQYIIPIDLAGRLKIYPHAGITSALYQSIKATQLTLAHSESPDVKKLQQDLEEVFQSLPNNLLVIGLDQKQDQHITLNSGQKVSLAELTTRSIATIQSGRFIEQWPLSGKLLSFALILLLSLKIYQGSRRQVLIWGSISTFLYFSASVLIFNSTLTWNPPFPAFALFTLLILIGTILPYSPAPTTLVQTKLSVPSVPSVVK